MCCSTTSSCRWSWASRASRTCRSRRAISRIEFDVEGEGGVSVAHARRQRRRRPVPRGQPGVRVDEHPGRRRRSSSPAISSSVNEDGLYAVATIPGLYPQGAGGVTIDSMTISYTGIEQADVQPQIYGGPGDFDSNGLVERPRPDARDARLARLASATTSTAATSSSGSGISARTGCRAAGPAARWRRRTKWPTRPAEPDGRREVRRTLSWERRPAATPARATRRLRWPTTGRRRGARLPRRARPSRSPRGSRRSKPTRLAERRMTTTRRNPPLRIGTPRSPTSAPALSLAV